MNYKDFAYWLKGYLDSKELLQDDLKTISDNLEVVFSKDCPTTNLPFPAQKQSEACYFNSTL